MKRISLFVILIAAAGSLLGQEQFIGEWSLQQLTMENLEKKDVISREQLKEDSTIWIMRFSGDGSFYQKSNFNAASRMDELKGTWKTEPNEKLTIFLVIEGQRRPLQFFYTFRDDVMILERYDQLRTFRMVTEFRKQR